MAEQTRHYGGGPAPKQEPGAATLGLAETEVAPTLIPARPAGPPGASAPVAVIAQPIPVELAPGTELGEYVVGRKLGEGGMGAVYAGEQPTIGKRVAIKVLAAHCAANPELLRRFVEEARAANLIHHPHIIDVFSFGQLPDGRLYFVMEFLDGESLADAIEHEHLRPDEIRRLLHQVCGALEATHRVGIVHRDLKPENIWIARPPHGESYVKLLDFGIAKLLDPTHTHLTHTGAVLGTPLFMSPEQCLARPVDARTDIYALGVMLYRIFTGRYPFAGTAITELALQHVSEPPPPPSHYRPLPPELERVILDCLAKDAALRPASAEELGARLDAALDAWPEHSMATKSAGVARSIAPIEIRNRSMVAERTLPGSRRRATWPLPLVLAAAVVALVAAILLLRARSGAPPVSRPVETMRPAPTLEPPPVVPAKPAPAASDESHAQAEAAQKLEPAKSPPPRGSGRPRPKTGRVPELLATPTAAAPAKPVEPTAAPAPAKPSPEPPAQAPATPSPRPTRAQQRGLLDENPLR